MFSKPAAAAKRSLVARRPMPYALAVLAVLAAFLAAVLLSDAIRPNFSPLFFVAITFAAWWGGLGPGLLATLIAVVLLEYIFAFPSGAMWEPGSLVRTAMFLLAALLINSLHAARQRAETELARRAHLAEFTAAFGQLLATARGELPMLEGCARIVRESLPVEQVGLWTVDGEDGDSGEPEVLRRRVHLGPESAAPGQRRVVGESEREPDVVPLAVRPEESDWLARVIRRGRDENTVARIERGNGVRYALPLVADGQILGALDVWCREAALPEMAEAALLTAADRLAVAISARHAGEMLARQTETLQVALDQAGEASRMKNDFFASISHEIRTPMNGVLGMADLLRDTTLSGSQQEMVEAIRTSADSLLALLNDILDFSRGAAGKLSLDAVPFDLRQVVEQVADLMAPLADQRGLELLVRYHEQTPRRLIGDSGRVRQILVNLVSNAIKFTENGFVLLDVQVTQTAEEEALLIAVQDSGVGIPEDKLDYIFERFAQADSGSVRRPGGAGLGLAICRQLAEVMGGTIGVTSKPGAGSTFWFVLRLPHDPTAPPANPPDYSDLQVVGGVPDLVAREVLRDTLAGWRINPVLFGSTGETSQFLNTMPASPERETVIVLDQALLGPGDAGSELRSALRHCAGCSAILLTPAGDVGQRQPEIFEDVAWTVLPRPLTPTRLRRALRTARPKAAGGDEQRPPTPADDPAANAAPTKDAPLWVAGRKPRILVAEDNRINQWVTAAQLQRMGCEITVVENGAEAVAATMRETFDLILMDCQMPRMDGYEATRQILRQSGPATPPILAMTANASPQDRERCLQVGMSGCLVKPVREAQLRPILAELLSGATEPPVIDTPSLWARYGDDAEILRPAVEIYRREMPALLQTLQTAAAGKNWPEVHRRAHEIKGVALQYDANILAETAQQLMQATQAAGEETSVAESDAYTLVAAIQALARRVEPMLLQMLAEQSAREF